jgi:chromate transporter
VIRRHRPCGTDRPGPASSGPASNDPASNDPASNDPASNGPASNGPASNGPASSDPASSDAAAEVHAGTAGPVPRGSVLEVLGVATRLGFTSFGGPIAHLGYFRQEYVVKRRWLDEPSYADLVALCQFLPGATSSKLGMSIGILRAGLPGGLVAWLGFTLPSAIALTAAAIVLSGVDNDTLELLHGLKVVAVAVVAQAVWGMARNLAPDRARATIAIGASAAAFALPTTIAQVTVIAVAAVVGWRFLRADHVPSGSGVPVPIPRWLAITAWILLCGLLVGLPVAHGLVGWQPLALFDGFFRSGSLVFGGGHVVLPLLQAEVVPTGWVDPQQFLAGYGLAQAVPGPLFTFAGYLGAAMRPEPNGVAGAAIALVAIFLPSMLLTLGALPLWGTLRSRRAVQAALRGVNAAVVGILLAALYSPVWTTAIRRPVDFVLALCAFGLLVIWRVPPWVVVLLAAAAGAVLAVTT